jgi:hypothetical protein
MNPRLTVALCALALTSGLEAQVGHDPFSSPYRDLRLKHTLTFFGGYITSGEGRADVGPSNGALAGVRWDIHVGGATSLFLGVAGAAAERNLVDPTLPPDTRYFATASQQLFILDGGFNLILTGRKTWHGLAPYVGGSMGMVLGAAVPQDTVSGFTFNNKFQLGPQIGIRFFPTRRVHLRIEGRNVMWRLKYPGAFFSRPLTDPSAASVLDPVTTKNSEWVHHPVLKIGLGWTL